MEKSMFCLCGASGNDQNFAVEIAWTPDPVVIVAADGGRKPSFFTKECDSPGLTIVVSENTRIHAFLYRQLPVDFRDLVRQLPPSKHVRIKLWQIADFLPLFGRWLNAKLFCIRNVPVHW